MSDLALSILWGFSLNSCISLVLIDSMISLTTMTVSQGQRHSPPPEAGSPGLVFARTSRRQVH